MSCDKLKIQKLKNRGMGVMMAPVFKQELNNNRFNVSFLKMDLDGLYFAVDNGAFAAWNRQKMFNEYAFLKLLDLTIDLPVDFIITPDIVAGGLRSLEFSMHWAQTRLVGPAPLALCVQDEMLPNHITDEMLGHYTHIMVGGTPKWKWEWAATWVDFAHSKIGKFGEPLKCHIGQCGTPQRLRYAEKIGADSVDSTNFIREKKGRFHIIDEYRNPTQTELFKN